MAGRRSGNKTSRILELYRQVRC